MTFRIALIAIIFASTQIHLQAAESNADGTLSLFEAIDLTREKHPDLRLYPLRDAALQGDQQSAGLAPRYRFSAEVENALGTGDLSGVQAAEFTLALSHIVELGGKRSYRLNTVSKKRELLRAEQQTTELDLLAETTSRYISLAAAEQHLRLLNRIRELAAETLSTVSERVDAGRAPGAERARASAVLSRAELAVSKAEYGIEAARIMLSSMWGELSPAFGSLSAELMSVENSEPVDTLLQRVESNPAITVFASESRLQEARLKEAISQSKMDIEWSAGIRHIRSLNDTALTISASIPLYSASRASGAISTARANLNVVETEREAALLRLQSQLLFLYQQRRQVVEEFSVLRTAVIPSLNSALEQTRETYAAGRYSFLELHSAQNELMDAEFSLIEAAERAHQLQVEIERLSGEALEDDNQ